MPVCIAGMHRSGTSMVAKLLKESGLYLGPDGDLMPPARENPEGFWENLHFVDLNEELINQLGGGWDCPPPIPQDWTTGQLAPLQTKAETIVAHFAGREPWGWKDPRNSLTLPFWQGILGPTKVVVVIRNPLEVALSLRLRNGFSFALGLTLWQIYGQRILADAAPADRIVTHYDAYFGDPETELRRLLGFLEMQFDQDVVADFRASNPAGLRHHRVTTAELVDADVSSAVFTLYRALCDEAEWRDTDAARPQPAVAIPGDKGQPPAPAKGRRQVPPPPSTLAIGVGRLNRSAMEVRILQRDLEEHQQSLEEHQQSLEEVQQSLEKCQQSVEEHQQSLEKCQQSVVEHQQSVEEHQQSLEKCQQSVVEHQQSLEEYQQSVVEYQQSLAAREARVVELELTVRAQKIALARLAELEEMLKEHEAIARDVIALRQTVDDQAEHVALVGDQIETMTRYEEELRGLLLSAHEELLHRDAEVMATLGTVFARHAPGAPAAIYYRQLLQMVRGQVAANLPAGAPVAVISAGDDAMLQLDGRDAWHFPLTEDGPMAEYAAFDSSVAIAQLELLRSRGARYLVVPASALAWLARHPDFDVYLGQHHSVVLRQEGICVVYALSEPAAASAA